MTATREIHDRARRSRWLVLSRQAVVAVLGLTSGIVLARKLSPLPGRLRFLASAASRLRSE